MALEKYDREGNRLDRRESPVFVAHTMDEFVAFVGLIADLARGGDPAKIAELKAAITGMSETRDRVSAKLAPKPPTPKRR